MVTPKSEHVHVTPPAAPSRFVRVLAWLGVSVAVVGAAYGAGRLQTASRIDAAEQRVTQANDARDRTHKELSAERAEVHRLEARRRLHLALIALEARNFGIAQAELEAAAILLALGNAGAPGALADLQREVAGTRLVATEDVGQSRQRILDWVRRFDTLEPPAAAEKK